MDEDQGTMDEAMAAFMGADGEESPPTEQSPPAEPETIAGGEPQEKPPTAAAGEPDESKTSLWRRITEQDRELRALKQAAKQKAPQAHGLDDLRAQAAEDPQGFLEKFGLSFDKVFDAWNSNIQKESEKPPQRVPQADPGIIKELQELKQKLSSYEEAQRKSESQQFHMREISMFGREATQDAGRWALVNKAKEDGSLELALQVAAKMYQETGDLPDRGHVLDCVEEHLRSQAKKFSSWLGAVPQETAPLAKPQESKSSGQEQTLNGQGDDTSVPKELTDEELFQLALAELGR